MTLLESCVSVAIVGIVTAIAVPDLNRSRDEYLLNSAARDVATRLTSARIRATSANHDCRFRVTSAVTYAVECQDSVWAVMESAVLPRGLTIAANAKPEFHRLGNVAPTATITLSNSNGRQKKVVVNNGGRIRID